MPDRIRWGIIGTGSIARQFARGLGVLGDAQLVAVGSRARETADRFADEFNVPRRHASYEALAADPDVDVVYVATPHALHKENSILCIKAGKAVLCEKPFAINARQAAAVIRAARKHKVFLMEAMWTRFFPAMAKVRRWLAEGAIGDVQVLTADFGFRATVNAKSRLFNPGLGGGALLDVGVYTVSLAHMVYGAAPAHIATIARLGRTGVDEQDAVVLGYDKGRLAVLYTTIRLNTPHEARILGTDGRIEIPPSFWKPTVAILSAGDRHERSETPLQGNGYNYEAAEVMRCIRQGKRESSIMPLDETLSVMKTLDKIRAEWGLKYPME